MIKVVNKGEVWHGVDTQVQGEIASAYLDIVGLHDEYIANIVVRGRLKANGLHFPVNKAVLLYGGPKRTYMGSHSPMSIAAWLEVMGADWSALRDVCQRGGWWR